MATVVMALGGSLLRPEVEERHEWLSDLINVIGRSVESGKKVAIVVGGGSPAREAIDLARPLIKDTSHLDMIGIAATRLNATIVKESLSAGRIRVSAKIPKTIEEALLELVENDVIVMGGTLPGHTTDAVAIRLAIRCGAEKCIIATNVSKVFSTDPRINPRAESFDSLTLSQLQEIVGPPEHNEAGSSQVVDPVGVGDALEHNLPIDVLDGRDARIIQSSLEGSDFEGTKVRADGQ